jgi:hypothetical protein
MAAALGAARIGHFTEGVAQGFELVDVERAVTVLGVPLGAEFAQPEAEALGGEIGPAGFSNNEKAAVAQRV